MDIQFSQRIKSVPRSFIREIFKDAMKPGTISFAGGLPNSDLFPVDEIRQASNYVFEHYGRKILQYSNSEGLLPLREEITARYLKQGIDVSTDNILIINGSQQGLDLICKVLIDEGDKIAIEEPGYLGAIQALGLYQPEFLPISVSDQGLNIEQFRQTMSNSEQPKLVYTVPNFQNPSGITYSEENRTEIASILKGSRTFLIEDNPYGELRFEGKPAQSFMQLAPENTILLGSFSKVVAPSFRLGWIVAPPEIMEKLITAKQAADLHTNFQAQCVIYEYLRQFDLDKHIEKINAVYGDQRNAMLKAIHQYLPESIGYTVPEGGMFLWLTLPDGFAAMDLFHLAKEEGVVFIPGEPFYIGKENVNTLRLSFSSLDVASIETGVQRLAMATEKLFKGH